MFENMVCLSISLHLSLVILLNLLALIYAWICQIYVKLLFFTIPPLIPLPSHLPLGHLSVIHNTFLLFPEHPCSINVTSISESYSELFPSCYPCPTSVQPRCLLQIWALTALFYINYCEFCSLFCPPSGLHIAMQRQFHFRCKRNVFYSTPVATYMALLLKNWCVCAPLWALMVLRLRLLSRTSDINTPHCQLFAISHNPQHQFGLLCYISVTAFHQVLHAASRATSSFDISSFCLHRLSIVAYRQTVKLSLCSINYAPRHADAWGRGCIGPLFLDPGPSWR